MCVCVSVSACVCACVHMRACVRACVCVCVCVWMVFRYWKLPELWVWGLCVFSVQMTFLLKDFRMITNVLWLYLHNVSSFVSCIYLFEVVFDDELKKNRQLENEDVYWLVFSNWIKFILSRKLTSSRGMSEKGANCTSSAVRSLVAALIQYVSQKVVPSMDTSSLVM